MHAQMNRQHQMWQHQPASNTEPNRIHLTSAISMCKPPIIITNLSSPKVKCHCTSPVPLSFLKQMGVGQRLPLEPDLGSTSEQQSGSYVSSLQVCLRYVKTKAAEQ